MGCCIYCKGNTSGVEAKAHAIPEALSQNSFVLPRGAVCDQCNGYLAKLDKALVLHKQIWLAIQVFALPGKSGNPRGELGWMKRPDLAHPNRITIEGRGKNLLFVEGNRVRIETTEAPGWDSKKFRRALHYVGLNYLALTVSPEFVLQSRFDEVRRYIRFPRKGETWPYGEIQRSRKLLQRIDFERVADAPGEVIAIGLFHWIFFVDLLGRQQFVEWLPRAVSGSTAGGRTTGSCGRTTGSGVFN